VIAGQWLTKRLDTEGALFQLLPHKYYVNLYIVLSILCLPFLVKSAIALASHKITTNFFVNLRISLSNVENPQSFGILAYAATFAFSGLFLKLVDTRVRLLSSGVLISTLACLCYALLGTGRAYFFQFLVPAFFIILFARPGTLKSRHIVIFFTVLFSVFVFMGMLLNKIGGEDKGVLKEFGLYLLGGASAFQEILAAPQHLEYGANTFRTIYAVLAAVGIDVNVVKLVQEFVLIPEPTNVYTVFQPYYLDFGISFVLISQFFFGLMHSCLYSMAVRRSSMGILLYSLSMYPLFMQWFLDQYFSLLSLWVQYLILLLIPLGISWVSGLFRQLIARGESSGVA